MEFSWAFEMLLGSEISGSFVRSLCSFDDHADAYDYE